MKTVLIIGAGVSGLVAAQMLRRNYNCIVVERSQALTPTNNAVMRLRSRALETAGVKLRRVKVLKSVLNSSNFVRDALSYAYKCTGEYRSDRSMPQADEIVERFVADDLLGQLSQGIDIRYGCNVNSFAVAAEEFAADHVISTIALPAALQLTLPGFDSAQFKFQKGFVVNARVSNCNAYASLYVPLESSIITRISITGDNLAIEFKFDSNYSIICRKFNDILEEVCSLIGFRQHELYDVKINSQAMHKIVPIGERKRKDYVRSLTDNFNIYSLGRFATWRPKLLADDLVRDVKLIERMMNGLDNAIVDKGEYA